LEAIYIPVIEVGSVPESHMIFMARKPFMEITHMKPVIMVKPAITLILPIVTITLFESTVIRWIPIIIGIVAFLVVSLLSGSSEGKKGNKRN